jgi:hypothetical protein
MSSHRMSRRELALVAAALLLPVPLIAESGLSLPVPGAVKHGFGSLITLDADRDSSGTTARGTVSESGTSPSHSGSAETQKGGGDTEDTGSSGDHGGTDRPTSPGDTGTSRDDSGGAPQFKANHMPSVDLQAAGQGTTSGVSVNADAVDVDVAANSGGAGGDESAGLGVAVTDTAGSQTGLDIAIR